jgi:hypothetical protein
MSSINKRPTYEHSILNLNYKQTVVPLSTMTIRANVFDEQMQIAVYKFSNYCPTLHTARSPSTNELM